MNSPLSAEELAHEEQAAAAEVSASLDAMLKEQGRAFPDGMLKPDREEALREAQDRFDRAKKRHDEWVQLRLAASR